MNKALLKKWMKFTDTSCVFPVFVLHLLIYLKFLLHEIYKETGDENRICFIANFLQPSFAVGDGYSDR